MTRTNEESVRFLRSHEAAEYVGLSVPRLSRLAAKGKIERYVVPRLQSSGRGRPSATGYLLRDLDRLKAQISSEECRFASLLIKCLDQPEVQAALRLALLRTELQQKKPGDIIPLAEIAHDPVTGWEPSRKRSVITKPLPKSRRQRRLRLFGREW